MHGAAELLALDQAGILQHADVLQDRRQRDGERLSEVARRLRAALRELGQHCASRRIGERGECPVQRVVRIVNHMV